MAGTYLLGQGAKGLFTKAAPAARKGAKIYMMKRLYDDIERLGDDERDAIEKKLSAQVYQKLPPEKRGHLRKQLKSKAFRKKAADLAFDAGIAYSTFSEEGAAAPSPVMEGEEIDITETAQRVSPPQQIPQAPVAKQRRITGPDEPAETIEVPPKRASQAKPVIDYASITRDQVNRIRPLLKNYDELLEKGDALSLKKAEGVKDRIELISSSPKKPDLGKEELQRVQEAYPTAQSSETTAPSKPQQPLTPIRGAPIGPERTQEKPSPSTIPLKAPDKKEPVKPSEETPLPEPETKELTPKKNREKLKRAYDSSQSVEKKMRIVERLVQDLSGVHLTRAEKQAIPRVLREAFGVDTLAQSFDNILKASKDFIALSKDMYRDTESVSLSKDMDRAKDMYQATESVEKKRRIVEKIMEDLSGLRLTKQEKQALPKTLKELYGVETQAQSFEKVLRHSNDFISLAKEMFSPAKTGEGTLLQQIERMVNSDAERKKRS